MCIDLLDRNLGAKRAQLVLGLLQPLRIAPSRIKCCAPASCACCATRRPKPELPPMMAMVLP